MIPQRDSAFEKRRELELDEEKVPNWMTILERIIENKAEIGGVSA